MTRRKELDKYTGEFGWIHIDKPANLNSLYEMGMLKVSQLEDGAYYLGQCRNAFVARWDATKKKFWYMRFKFGRTFPEDIRHPEDDDGHDLFIPFEKVTPADEEKIKGSWVAPEKE